MSTQNSLETSAKKIESLLAQQTQDLQDQIKKNSEKTCHRQKVEDFMKEHENEGLLISSKNNKFWALCKLCHKYENRILKSKYYDSEWVSGLKLLDSNRKRTWERHLKSDQHSAAIALETQPSPHTMFDYAAQKAKEYTMNFLRISYACLQMYIPYGQLIRLFSALYLCGFAVGNAHYAHNAAFKAVDNSQFL